MSLARFLRLPGTHPRRGAPRRTLVLACYVLAILGASYYLLQPSFSSSALASDGWSGQAGHSGAQAGGGGVGSSKKPTRKRRPRPAEAQQKPPARPKFPQHEFRRDGLLGVNPDGRHPIYDLIDRAERDWEGKLKRASKSLDEAVAEYHRRYGRNPPKGFDKWWDYVEANNVQLPDEYDQIWRDIEPFWAQRPQDLRALALETEGHFEETWDSFTIGKIGKHAIGLVNISLKDDQLQLHLKSAYEMIDTLKPVEDLLPPFRAVFSPHDNPTMGSSWQWMEKARQAIKAGKYLSIENPQFDGIGWLAACAPDSPARLTPFELDNPPPPPISKTFIYDHRAAMDPCQHPRHLHIHGEYVSHAEGAPPHLPLVPVFSFSTSPLHYDIRPATPFNWVEDVPGDTSWEHKTDTRLLWRGRNTGIWHNPTMRWRQQQRVRMIQMATDTTGEVDVLLAGGADRRVGSREMKVAKLNEQLMDMAFVGEPLACDLGACEELKEMFDFKKPMDWKTAANYKYVMDMDGNGWSSRFKRLITTHSLVFKATGYPEWFTDRIVPWVHYVPIQLDLSDVYDALVFFRGDVNGDGAHDDLAKKIALAGREWSKTFWRREDMTAYNFRLMLEYARLMSFDRDAMTYRDPEEGGA